MAIRFEITGRDPTLEEKRDNVKAVVDIRAGYNNYRRIESQSVCLPDGYQILDGHIHGTAISSRPGFILEKVEDLPLSPKAHVDFVKRLKDQAAALRMTCEVKQVVMCLVPYRLYVEMELNGEKILNRYSKGYASGSGTRTVFHPVAGELKNANTDGPNLREWMKTIRAHIKETG